MRKTGLSVLVLARIIERGAIALRLRLGLLQRDPIIGRVDFKQVVALMHELVVGDIQLDDSPRHLGRSRTAPRPGGVPASWQHRLEITSFTFMLNWVPLPVIQTWSGNMS